MEQDPQPATSTRRDSNLESNLPPNALGSAPAIPDIPFWVQRPRTLTAPGASFQQVYADGVLPSLTSLSKVSTCPSSGISFKVLGSSKSQHSGRHSYDESFKKPQTSFDWFDPNFIDLQPPAASPSLTKQGFELYAKNRHVRPPINFARKGLKPLHCSSVLDFFYDFRLFEPAPECVPIISVTFADELPEARSKACCISLALGILLTLFVILPLAVTCLLAFVAFRIAR